MMDKKDKFLRKQKSNIVDSNEKTSNATPSKLTGPINVDKIPIKKSGTLNEKNELNDKMGLTPLRHKKNNVIMAYNV